MRGKVRILKEEKDNKYELNELWIPKYKDRTVSINVIKYSSIHKM